MTSKFLPGTQIELISESIPAGRFRHVFFDFDGTISLIRRGWQRVMIPMMARTLAQTPRAESSSEIEQFATELVTRMTGRQTIYQMLALREEVMKRGGAPREALEYKREYLGLLMAHIGRRREGLAEGSLQPDEMLVPGSMETLKALRSRGMTLYCASGTDEPFVREEARLLGIAEYFDGGLFGALDDYENFSKRMLIGKIFCDNKLQGREFLGFGDGFVEIEETKAAGGVAVGVAADEEKRGGIDRWKRDCLIGAGADIIVPHFRESDALLRFLLG